MPRFSPDDPVASSSSLHKEIPSGEERGKEGLKVRGEENSSFFPGASLFIRAALLLFGPLPTFYTTAMPPKKAVVDVVVETL